MYVLSNGHNYIGVNGENIATSVSNIKKALLFSDELIVITPKMMKVIDIKRYITVQL